MGILDDLAANSQGGELQLNIPEAEPEPTTRPWYEELLTGAKLGAKGTLENWDWLIQKISDEGVVPEGWIESLTPEEKELVDQSLRAKLLRGAGQAAVQLPEAIAVSKGAGLLAKAAKLPYLYRVSGLAAPRGLTTAQEVASLAKGTPPGMFIDLSTAAGFGGLGALGAAAQSGTTADILRAGATGAVMGGAMHPISQLAMPTRIPAMGGLFGGASVVGGAPAEDIIPETILGGLMGVPGGWRSRTGSWGRKPEEMPFVGPKMPEPEVPVTPTGEVGTGWERFLGKQYPLETMAGVTKEEPIIPGGEAFGAEIPPELRGQTQVSANELLQGLLKAERASRKKAGKPGKVPKGGVDEAQATVDQIVAGANEERVKTEAQVTTKVTAKDETDFWGNLKAFIDGAAGEKLEDKDLYVVDESGAHKSKITGVDFDKKFVKIGTADEAVDLTTGDFSSIEFKDSKGDVHSIVNPLMGVKVEELVETVKGKKKGKVTEVKRLTDQALRTLKEDLGYTDTEIKDMPIDKAVDILTAKRKKTAEPTSDEAMKAVAQSIADQITKDVEAGKPEEKKVFEYSKEPELAAREKELIEELGWDIDEVRGVDEDTHAFLMENRIRPIMVDPDPSVDMEAGKITDMSESAKKLYDNWKAAEAKINAEIETEPDPTKAVAQAVADQISGKGVKTEAPSKPVLSEEEVLLNQGDPTGEISRIWRGKNAIVKLPPEDYPDIPKTERFHQIVVQRPNGSGATYVEGHPETIQNLTPKELQQVLKMQAHGFYETGGPSAAGPVTKSPEVRESEKFIRQEANRRYDPSKLPEDLQKLKEMDIPLDETKYSNMMALIDRYMQSLDYWYTRFAPKRGSIAKREWDAVKYFDDHLQKSVKAKNTIMSYLEDIRSGKKTVKNPEETINKSLNTIHDLFGRLEGYYNARNELIDSVKTRVRDDYLRQHRAMEEWKVDKELRGGDVKQATLEQVQRIVDQITGKRDDVAQPVRPTAKPIEDVIIPSEEKIKTNHVVDTPLGKKPGDTFYLGNVEIADPVTDTNIIMLWSDKPARRKGPGAPLTSVPKQFGAKYIDPGKYTTQLDVWGKVLPNGDIAIEYTFPNLEKIQNLPFQEGWEKEYKEAEPRKKADMDRVVEFIERVDNKRKNKSARAELTKLWGRLEHRDPASGKMVQYTTVSDAERKEIMTRIKMIEAEESFFEDLDQSLYDQTMKLHPDIVIDNITKRQADIQEMKDRVVSQANLIRESQTQYGEAQKRLKKIYASPEYAEAAKDTTAKKGTPHRDLINEVTRLRETINKLPGLIHDMKAANEVIPGKVEAAEAELSELLKKREGNNVAYAAAKARLLDAVTKMKQFDTATIGDVVGDSLLQKNPDGSFSLTSHNLDPNFPPNASRLLIGQIGERIVPFGGQLKAQAGVADAAWAEMANDPTLLSRDGVYLGSKVAQAERTMKGHEMNWGDINQADDRVQVIEELVDQKLLNRNKFFKVIEEAYNRKYKSGTVKDPITGEPVIINWKENPDIRRKGKSFFYELTSLEQKKLDALRAEKEQFGGTMLVTEKELESILTKYDMPELTKAEISKIFEERPDVYERLNIMKPVGDVEYKPTKGGIEIVPTVSRQTLNKPFEELVHRGLVNDRTPIMYYGPKENIQYGTVTTVPEKEPKPATKRKAKKGEFESAVPESELKQIEDQLDFIERQLRQGKSLTEDQVKFVKEQKVRKEPSQATLTKRAQAIVDQIGVPDAERPAPDTPGERVEAAKNTKGMTILKTWEGEKELKSKKFRVLVDNKEAPTKYIVQLLDSTGNINIFFNDSFSDINRMNALLAKSKTKAFTVKQVNDYIKKQSLKKVEEPIEAADKTTSKILNKDKKEAELKQQAQEVVDQMSGNKAKPEEANVTSDDLTAEQLAERHGVSVETMKDFLGKQSRVEYLEKQIKRTDKKAPTKMAKAEMKQQLKQAQFAVEEAVKKLKEEKKSQTPKRLPEYEEEAEITKGRKWSDEKELEEELNDYQAYLEMLQGAEMSNPADVARVQRRIEKLQMDLYGEIGKKRGPNKPTTAEALESLKVFREYKSQMGQPSPPKNVPIEPDGLYMAAAHKLGNLGRRMLEGYNKMFGDPTPLPDQWLFIQAAWDPRLTPQDFANLMAMRPQKGGWKDIFAFGTLMSDMAQSKDPQLARIGYMAQYKQLADERWRQEVVQPFATKVKDLKAEAIKNGNKWENIVKELWDFENDDKPLQNPYAKEIYNTFLPLGEQIAQIQNMAERAIYRKRYIPHRAAEADMFENFRKAIHERVDPNKPEGYTNLPDWVQNKLDPTRYFDIKRVFDTDRKWDQLSNLEKNVIRSELWSWNGALELSKLPSEIRRLLPREAFSGHEQRRFGDIPSLDPVDNMILYMADMGSVMNNNWFLSQVRPVLNSMPWKNIALSKSWMAEQYVKHQIRGIGTNPIDKAADTVINSIGAAFTKFALQPLGYEKTVPLQGSGYLTRGIAKQKTLMAAGALGPGTAIPNLFQGLNTLVERGTGAFGAQLAHRLRAGVTPSKIVKDLETLPQGKRGKMQITREIDAADIITLSSIPFDGDIPLRMPNGETRTLKELGITERLWDRYIMPINRLALKPMMVTEVFNRGCDLYIGVAKAAQEGKNWNVGLAEGLRDAMIKHPTMTMEAELFNNYLTTQHSQFAGGKAGVVPIVAALGPLGQASSLFWTFPLKQVAYFHNGIYKSLLSGDDAKLARYMIYLGFQATAAMMLAQVGVDVSNIFGRGVVPMKLLSLPLQQLKAAYGVVNPFSSYVERQNASDDLVRTVKMMIPFYHGWGEKAYNAIENISRGTRVTKKGYPLVATTPLTEILGYFNLPPASAGKMFDAIQEMQAETEESNYRRSRLLQRGVEKLTRNEDISKILTEAYKLGIPVASFRDAYIRRQKLSAAEAQLQRMPKAKQKEWAPVINQLRQDYLGYTGYATKKDGERPMWGGTPAHQAMNAEEDMQNTVTSLALEGE